jgi:ribonuclease inhibitor
MKKYVLDGRAILSLSDFYNELAKALSLPGYFGHNLDALADILLTDVKGPLEIVWEYSSLSSEAMPQDYSRISTVLRHIARKRPDCKIMFR